MDFSILDVADNQGLAQYLDWLNMDDCSSFDYARESPWKFDGSLNVLLSLEESREQMLTDFFTCGRLRIVSGRMRQIIAEFNSNVEFVPVRILCGPEKEFHYYAIHIMAILDLVDREKSQFAEVKYGMVAGITSLFLKQMPDEDICLLKDTFRSITLISSLLRNRIEKDGLTGVRIVELASYTERTYPTPP